MAWGGEAACCRALCPLMTRCPPFRFQAVIFCRIGKNARGAHPACWPALLSMKGPRASPFHESGLSRTLKNSQMIWMWNSSHGGRFPYIIPGIKDGKWERLKLLRRNWTRAILRNSERASASGRAGIPPRDGLKKVRLAALGWRPPRTNFLKKTAWEGYETPGSPDKETFLIQRFPQLTIFLLTINGSFDLYICAKAPKRLAFIIVI